MISPIPRGGGGAARRGGRGGEGVEHVNELGSIGCALVGGVQREDQPRVTDGAPCEVEPSSVETDISSATSPEMSDHSHGGWSTRSTVSWNSLSTSSSTAKRRRYFAVGVGAEMQVLALPHDRRRVRLVTTPARDHEHEPGGHGGESSSTMAHGCHTLITSNRSPKSSPPSRRAPPHPHPASAAENIDPRAGAPRYRDHHTATLCRKKNTRDGTA